MFERVGRSSVAAARGLWRRRGFLTAAVLSLGLAVGANAAVFSIVNALWLRPRPIADPERLVNFYFAAPGSSDGAFRDNLKASQRASVERLTSFAGVAFELRETLIATGWSPVVRFAGSEELLHVQAVSHNYFSVMGVEVVGRPFEPANDTALDPVAVASAGWWTRQFGQEAFQAREIATTAGRLRIVAVVVGDFQGPRQGEDVDLWLPLGAIPRFSELAAAPNMLALMPLAVFGRLRDGVSLSQAETEARSAVDRRTVLRSLADVGFALRAEGDLTRLSSSLRLQGAMGLAVAIFGAITLTNLFLSRVGLRREEIAVRLAVGASRRDAHRRVMVCSEERR